jgi:4-amino-4-deoxy-L-arabinose transferase-like glycosyltransferase
MPPNPRPPHGSAKLRLAGYALAVLLAAFTYFYALDSQYIPKNTDEYPYAHITWSTAASGHLLPLQSQLVDTRNTKPPLLFWQGIVATDWGRSWTLWNLRYPSVLYTLATAAMVFLLGRRLAGDPAKGFIAALAFLAFYTTYRYGRPFLTNAPEVFWLFLPCFVLLHGGRAAFASRVWVPLLLGLALGVCFLYKSFALALPAGAGLAWWHLHRRGYRLGEFLRRDAGKVALTLGVALGVFSLWFLVDPDPGAVWREFVVGENVGKFDPQGHGYLATLLWGGSSVWSQVVAYPGNAGLLAIPVAVLFVVAFRRRAKASEGERLLWIWVITLFLVFNLPNQRSGRYLLAGMPALAVLLALHWEHLPRKALASTLVLAGIGLAAMAYLSLRLQGEMAGQAFYPLAYGCLLAGTGAWLVLALVVPRWTRPSVCAVAILSLLCLAAFMRPFDGPLGNYDAAAVRSAAGRDVWVPCNRRAKFEGYRFILPGARVHGYDEDRGLTVAELSARYPLFVVQLPLNEAAGTGGRILGRRLDMRGNQTGAEIKEMLAGRKLFQYLFVQELLIAPATPPKAGAVPADECL